MEHLILLQRVRECLENARDLKAEGGMEDFAWDQVNEALRLMDEADAQEKGLASLHEALDLMEEEDAGN